MFYQLPEMIWQELPSNISNLYCFNTVLHQEDLHRAASTPW